MIRKQKLGDMICKLKTHIVEKEKIVYCVLVSRSGGKLGRERSNLAKIAIGKGATWY